MGDVKMENLSLWVNLISNVGFPIIIAILLLRNLMSSIQERLDELNKTMNELLETIKKQNK
ncbi:MULTISPECIES: hypothetical protein [Paenibacillus]|jgi:hypothetical protein|uniref:hypothetical protein n=1 Tax=Paenibacillus TaxID=44249 RepID=UPI00096C5512|nr:MULTISPECIES: hypothetical protein [Paenibacillus]OMF26546.1 hypothetical protein BK134_22025 [Paenibacillus peoriae]QDA30305.1 hypothetical protein FGY93_25655 [Paenibacillus polymyxa]RTZ29756.1 hypothetical protein EJ573_24815 [Paenibacillus polymyxa]